MTDKSKPPIGDSFSKNSGGAHKYDTAITAFLDNDQSTMAAVMRNWHNPATPDPDIVAFITRVTERLGFKGVDKDLLIEAAEMAAIPNDAAYHNNVHFLEVFCGTMMMTQDRNALVAAAIHDIYHDSLGNQGEQFKLERQSYERAEERLKEKGATKRELQLIKAYVLSTDVSPTGPNGRPAAQTVKTFMETGNIEDLHQELRVLAEIHEELGISHAEIAMMIEQADIYIAFADPELQLLKDNSRGVEAEMKGKAEERKVSKQEIGNPNPGGVKFFIENICDHGKVYGTIAQKKLGQAVDHAIAAVKNKNFDLSDVPDITPNPNNSGFKPTEQAL